MIRNPQAAQGGHFKTRNVKIFPSKTASLSNGPLFHAPTPLPPTPDFLSKDSYLEPGLGWTFLIRGTWSDSQDACRCKFQDFQQSLTMANQVSLLRIFLSEPDSNGKSSDIWGLENKILTVTLAVGMTDAENTFVGISMYVFVRALMCIFVNTRGGSASWARAQGYCKRGFGARRKVEKIRAIFWDSKKTSQNL